MRGVYLFGYVKTKEPKVLKSASAIKLSVSDICKIAGLNVIGEKFHIFKKTSGITYCFILSQSHFIVHTWPEESKVFFDLFTCNDDIDEKRFLDLISKEFKGRVNEVRRIEYK